jgi:hypothetical protein
VVRDWGSGSNEAPDCCSCFLDLVDCDRATLTRGHRYAMCEMTLEQDESDIFEGLRGVGNLREDVDAVGIGIDHLSVLPS